MSEGIVLRRKDGDVPGLFIDLATAVPIWFLHRWLVASSSGTRRIQLRLPSPSTAPGVVFFGHKSEFPSVRVKVRYLGFAGIL